MSEQRDESQELTWSARTIDDLARAQHATVVSDSHELADDIWTSDDELDAFLADLRVGDRWVSRSAISEVRAG